MIALAAMLLPAAAAGGEASELALELRTAGLDAEECYRVRDLALYKEDIRLYFTEGLLIFGKPVGGRRYSAVFSARVEGGDGEVLLMPPTRSERLSLALFTDSPNLNEHFSSAVMIFSDDTAERLLAQIQEQPRVRKDPERGVLLARQWGTVVNSFSRSFATRLVYDILSAAPEADRFFYAALQSHRHGSFDIVYDPTAPEQIQAGQVRFRDDRPFFDVWTSFPARSFRNGKRRAFQHGFHLADFRIQAVLDEELHLSAATEAVLQVDDGPRRVFFFDISPREKVTEVTVDGVPCEIWQRESLRANLFGGGTGLFLVVAPKPLASGEYRIRFRHEGRVVSEAGEGVYYVGARGSWYPYLRYDFSYFDVTFRYPDGLDLVFPGDILEDRVEDGVRITRRRTAQPIRLLGFNVGRYEHVRAEREGFAVEVYANRRVEDALAPQRKLVLVPRRSLPSPGKGMRIPELVAMPSEVPEVDPTARLEPLANEVADALSFFWKHFGRPPVSTVMVSPIPGSFGQGFPGLLYVSTISYLKPEARPETARSLYNELFYSEILHAHEAAHQWWGNLIATDGYRDMWIMEALANYSALLLLERTRGPEALAAVLDLYRDDLLARNEEGQTMDAAGPIVWGPRLNSSRARAFRVILYEKGSWIIHMLRRRMGDEQFFKMLGDLCRKYRYSFLTTEEFRRHAAQFVPKDQPDSSLEDFFEQWVYDVGIPRLRLSQRVRGAAPRVRVVLTVSQAQVPDYFSVVVPVDIHLPGGRVLRRWVRTGDEPVTLDLTLPQRPVRVVLNPDRSVLAAPD